VGLSREKAHWVVVNQSASLDPALEP